MGIKTSVHGHMYVHLALALCIDHIDYVNVVYTIYACACLLADSGCGLTTAKVQKIKTMRISSIE